MSNLTKYDSIRKIEDEVTNLNTTSNNLNKGIVKFVYEGTGNYSYTSPTTLKSLAILNIGTEDIVIEVAGFTFSLKSNKGFDETFEEFTTINLTTTSSYQLLLRG